MNQARVNNSLERSFRSFLTPDLLFLNRHRVSGFVITGNRAVDERLGLFDDPIPGNGALDRLASASYQIVIEGSSNRERLSPHQALQGLKGVIDQPTGT